MFSIIYTIYLCIKIKYLGIFYFYQFSFLINLFSVVCETIYS